MRYLWPGSTCSTFERAAQRLATPAAVRALPRESLPLYQQAVILTHCRDFQAARTLNLWSPGFEGQCHGFSDRLAG